MKLYQIFTISGVDPKPPLSWGLCHTPQTLCKCVLPLVYDSRTANAHAQSLPPPPPKE